MTGKKRKMYKKPLLIMFNKNLVHFKLIECYAFLFHIHLILFICLHISNKLYILISVS